MIQFPSIIPNMPDAEYRAVDAISSTDLKTMWRYCPAIVKAQKDGLIDLSEKQELVTGIAAHVGALQPEMFDKLYAVYQGEELDLRTKRDKELWEAFKTANAGRICLRPTDGAIVRGIRKSIWAHPQAAGMLRCATDVELSVFWIDRHTGLRCKARADILCRSIGVMPDVKTTRSVDPERFQHIAFDLGYPIQLAHYWAGLAANNISVSVAPIIAAEKTPPYLVEVFEPVSSWMERGDEDRMAMLEKMRDCRETKLWPGYGGQVLPLKLPHNAIYRKSWQESGLSEVEAA